ncbi:MAG: RsmE family RNA methyltransferase [Candidatus Omnitrophica bacterium]|nr:RsmE family RNA methyltransferase [Candidatus Omnitrophota bacterium]
MNRFYCLRADISGDKITIQDREQMHHIKDVLRLKEGEKVAIFDEDKFEYSCVISKISDKVYLDIKTRVNPCLADSRFKLTIACAIPKKAKIDDITDKLVQLGVHSVIPLMTERVVVKLDKQKKLLRLERWKKIALSAAKQSQRNSLPIIEPVMSFKEVVALADKFDLKLIPTLGGRRKSLKEIFAKITPASIIVLIGPEGDFTDDEVNLAKKAGFIPITLGDLVLRVDTAALAIASFIRLNADH